MAVLAMEKVQILGMKTDLEKILTLLQKRGVMQVEEISEGAEFELENIEKEDHDIDFIVANTDFAIKLLTPYALKRPIWAGKPTLTSESAIGTVKGGFDYRAIIKECQSAEEKHNADQNNLAALETEEKLLQNWGKLNFALDTVKDTAHARIHLGEVPTLEYDALKAALKELGELTSINKVHEEGSHTYAVVAISKEYEDESKQLLSKMKFQEIELPELAMTVPERLKEITTQKQDLEQEITKNK
mgnify:FL=1